MKLHSMNRPVAAMLALGLCFGLVGCGASASSSESASEAVSVGEDAAAEDAYAYLADFSFDSLFDENGYVKGLTANDYVTLPENYDKMILDASLQEVSEEEIQNYIDAYVLSGYQTTESVTDRAAVNGDSVNIDYVGSIDGVEFEGGNSGGTGYDLVLGSGTFIDTFEDQIVGHMPGETFDVNVTFPENYGSTDLAGKDALFVTTLNHINETVTPEFTDEWVVDNLKESMGFSNVAEVRSFVESTLRFEQQANEIYGQLAENATFAEEYPQILQDYYRDVYLYTPYQYSRMYGVSMEEMLTYSGYADVTSYLTAMQTSIDASIRQQLLTQAVAEASGLVCDEVAAKDNFQRFYGSTDIDAYSENYGANYLRMTLLQDMSMQSLIDSATFE